MQLIDRRSMLTTIVDDIVDLLNCFTLRDEQSNESIDVQRRRYSLVEWHEWRCSSDVAVRLEFVGWRRKDVFKGRAHIFSSLTSEISSSMWHISLDFPIVSLVAVVQQICSRDQINLNDSMVLRNIFYPLFDQPLSAEWLTSNRWLLAKIPSACAVCWSLTWNLSHIYNQMRTMMCISPSRILFL